MAVSAHLKKDKGMQTEILPYSATQHRDVRARLSLQRANIMHLVDLKRGDTPRVVQKCESAASPLGCSQFRSYPKVWHPSLDVLITGRPCQMKPSQFDDRVLRPGVT
jgi:hypothetical protein